VDHVVSGIFHLSRRPDALGRVHHLTSPRPVRFDLVTDRLRQRGYRLDVLPLDRWVAALRDNAPTASTVDISALASAELLADTLPGVLTMGGVRFDRRNTCHGLADSALRFPDVDGDMIDRYIDHFVGAGFFPPPRIRP
jgi:hypothetical protein